MASAYPNAYLGHMASETVVSHNVMTSGQLPKHMGWSDEWYRDSAGLLGAVNGRYVTGSMSSTQFDTLINAGGYPKLADYLHAASPARSWRRSARRTTRPTPWAAPAPTCGSRSAAGPPTATACRTSRPTSPGAGRPGRRADYIRARSATASTSTPTRPWTTAPDISPAWMYPLEGNRDMAGGDASPPTDRHEGGDAWVTDVAFEVMDHEDWSGLLLTYGGIDKAGHMWGGLNDRPPYPGGDDHTHMAAAAKAADEQVGRVVQRLKDDGPARRDADRADHRPRPATSKHFFGVDGRVAGRGNFNWYYGTDADETYLDAVSRRSSA